MSHVTAMLDAYPKDLGNIDRQKLTDCIHACFACGETCTACADACLSEDMVAELTKCIRTNLDCADICTATGTVLSRHTGYDANITRALLEACRVACASCATECEAHADMHEHCRICAEACRRCLAARSGVRRPVATALRGGEWEGVHSQAGALRERHGAADLTVEVRRLAIAARAHGT